MWNILKFRPFSKAGSISGVHHHIKQSQKSQAAAVMHGTNCSAGCASSGSAGPALTRADLTKCLFNASSLVTLSSEVETNLFWY